MIDENGPQLLQSLRRALGPRPHFLLPDGYTPFAVLVGAGGPAAEGATVTLPAPATSQLKGPGRRFVRSFSRAIGQQPEPYAVTAAEAAETMLAAVAHSDGTRGSVLSHLLHDPVTNGILGSFRFDANGDTTQALVSVYRIEHAKPRLLTVIPTPTSTGR